MKIQKSQKQNNNPSISHICNKNSQVVIWRKDTHMHVQIQQFLFRLTINQIKMLCRVSVSPYIIIQRMNRCIFCKHSSLFLTIGIPECYWYAFCRLYLEYLLQRVSNHQYDIKILMRILKLIIINIHLSTKWHTLSCKGFNFFLLFSLLLISLFFILPTRLLHLILFPHRCCQCHLHLLILPCTTNVRSITFSLDPFLMISLYSLWIKPVLILVVLLEQVLWRLWICSIDWEYLIAWLLYRV